MNRKQLPQFHPIDAWSWAVRNTKALPSRIRSVWRKNKYVRITALSVGILALVTLIGLLFLRIKDARKISYIDSLNTIQQTLLNINWVSVIDRPSPVEENKQLLSNLQELANSCEQASNSELSSENVNSACEQLTPIIDYQIGLYSALINYFALEGDEEIKEIESVLNVTLTDFENIRKNSQVGDPALAEQIQRLQENKEVLKTATPHDIGVFIRKNQQNTLNDRLNYWTNLVGAYNFGLFMQAECKSVEETLALRWFAQCTSPEREENL